MSFNENIKNIKTFVYESSVNIQDNRLKSVEPSTWRIPSCLNVI